MREAYAAVAVDNYRQVGEAFDAAAADFSAAAERCDPEADADGIVGAADDVRRAWLDSAVLAGQLDRLVPVLKAAAVLAGAPSTAHRDVGGADAALLPLVCDPGEVHRRKVWEAWAATGRCGRWAALRAAGITIRAHPADHVATFEPYRAARPIEERWVPGGPLGVYDVVHHDPEDPQHAEIPQAVANSGRNRRESLPR